MSEKLDETVSHKKQFFFQLQTPWAHQDQPYVSFATGTCNCKVPPGAFIRKEIDDSEEEDDDDEHSRSDELSNGNSAKPGSMIHKASYVVPESESFLQEPTIVRWLSVPILPSKTKLYGRRTFVIQRRVILLDFVSSTFAFGFVFSLFAPPTQAVRPIDSMVVLVVTSLQFAVLFISTYATYWLHKRRDGSSKLFYALDILSNAAVLSSLMPLLYSYSLPDRINVSDPLFALLPLATIKIVPFFYRLDKQCFDNWIGKVVYRCFAGYFVTSWFFSATLFMFLHGDPEARRQECSPAIMWAHSLMLLVGAGLGNDLDMCTLSSASGPLAIAMAAITMFVIHAGGLSAIFIAPNLSMMTAHSRHRPLPGLHGQIEARSTATGNKPETVNDKIPSCVSLKWLKRRKLIVIVSQSQHLHPQHTRALLHTLLNPETTKCPGSSVSFLLPHLNDNVLSKDHVDESKKILSRLLEKKREWRNRVALVRQPREPERNIASRKALIEAGVPFSSNVLLPAAGVAPSEEADDLAVLWCTVIRSLAQDDASIFCEVYFPASKLPVLEAGANHVICLLELQWQLLGRSVGCPGVADLVMSLCEMKNEMALDARDRNHSIPEGNSYLLDDTEKDEDEGVSRIMPLKIPIRYNDLPFCEAAYHMFNEFGVCVFAANVSCSMDNIDLQQPSDNEYTSRSEVVLLNPAYRVKAEQRCVHAIAPSERTAFEAHTSRILEEENDQATADTDENNREGEKTELAELEVEEQKQKEKKAMLLKRKRPTSRDATELFLPADLLKPSEIPSIVPRPVRRGAPWKTPANTAELRRRSRHTMTGLTLLMRSDPSRAWMIADDTFDAGRPLWSVVKKNRVSDSNEYHGSITSNSQSNYLHKWTELDSAAESGIRGHVIIVMPSVGAMIMHVHRVVAAIRAEERQTWVPIVILSERPPPVNVCNGNDVGIEPRESSALPHVYWVRGDPRTREALLRSGVQSCRHVCVCPALVLEGVKEASAHKTDKSFSMCYNRGVAEQVRTIHLVRILSAAKSHENGIQTVISSCLDDPYSVLPDDAGSAAAVSACGESQENYISLRRLRGLLPQLALNPFLGDVVSAMASGGHIGPPEDIGPTGFDVYAENSTPVASILNHSVLQRTRKFLFLRSRIRTSFVRVRKIPKYLSGLPYIKLWEFSVFNDQGSIPLALLRVCGINEDIEASEEKKRKERGVKRGGSSIRDNSKSKVDRMRNYMRRRIIVNPGRDEIMRESDCFLSVVPSQYDHLMRHSHRVKREAREDTDLHYARQICDRASQIVQDQIDAIVEVQTRCRQAHESESELKMRREISRKARQSTNINLIAHARGHHIPPDTPVPIHNIPGKNGNNAENAEELQDLASQVLSLLRSSTSLLSILQWRSKRLIALRGDMSINGSEALVEAQKLFQETCMSESLVELMQERDIRIRNDRQLYKEKTMKDINIDSASQRTDGTVEREADDNDPSVHMED